MISFFAICRERCIHSLSSYRTLLRVLLLDAVDLLLLVINYLFDLSFVEAVDNGIFPLRNVD